MITAENRYHFILKFPEDFKLDQTYYNIIIKKLDCEKRESINKWNLVRKTSRVNNHQMALP